MNRRKFFSNATMGSLGTLMVNRIPQKKFVESPTALSDFDIMAEVNKYRKIDSHAHVYDTADSPYTQIDYADRLNIKTLIASKPVSPYLPGTPEQFRACNDRVLECRRLFPDRFIGQMTLNVKHQKESMQEIDRCIGEGMVGLKVYNHVKINDPLFYPVIEKFIDLKMVILMHVGIGKSRINYDAREPENVSIPSDFVEIAARYPEMMLQFAHLGGGEDWEDAVKALKHSPNVYVDVSGSNNDAAIIDFAMEYLGEDRILFGCDNSFYQGVGHLFAAELTPAQKHKIFFENYNNILKKSENHVD